MSDKEKEQITEEQEEQDQQEKIQKEDNQQEIDYKAEYEKMVAEKEEAKFKSLLEGFNSDLSDTLTDEFLNKVTEELKSNDYESAKKIIGLIKEVTDIKNQKTELRVLPNILSTGEVMENEKERKSFRDIILKQRKENK